MIKQYKIIIITFLFFFSLNLHSYAQSEAQKQLERSTTDVLKKLNDPAFRNDSTREKILADIEITIRQLFDFNELSARTVGPSWKKFSAEQKSRFTESFTTLLKETYLEKFDGYDGGAVTYLTETASTNGERVEIKTIVKIQQKDVPVAYRMIKKSKWVVYDIIIEGVSMVQNYRTQFQGILRKGDIESLINMVNKKAEEAKSYNQKQRSK